MKVCDCPKCGAPVEQQNSKQCGYCGVAFLIDKTSQLSGLDASLISKFKTLYDLSSRDTPTQEDVIGLIVCHMALSNYTVSTVLLEKAIQDFPLYGRAYYLKALSLIGQKKIKNLNIKEIKEIERLIFVAIDLDEKPEFWMLLAIVRYQYYRCSGLKVPNPDDDDILSGVKITDNDKDELIELVKKFNVRDPKFNLIEL